MTPPAFVRIDTLRPPGYRWSCCHWSIAGTDEQAAAFFERVRGLPLDGATIYRTKDGSYWYVLPEREMA